MMRKYLLLLIMFSMCEYMFSQATDLVIDNQTPGWLSSKINYGDQVTVRNLKVTGYINSTDLKFIGTLIQSYNLKSKLDLYDASIVASLAGTKNNYMGYDNGDVKTFGLTKNATIDTLLLPKTLLGLDKCLSYDSGKLYVNTLYFNNDSLTYINKDFFGGNYVKEYVLGEKIDSIPDNAFSNCSKLTSITIKGKLKYIGDKAFYNDTISSFNFPESLYYIGNFAFYGHKLKKISLPEAMKAIGTSAFHTTHEIDEVILPKELEELGDKAFDSYAPMVIKVPYGIKQFYMSSFKFVEGQEWYFPNTIDFIINPTCENKECVFYLEVDHVVGISSQSLYSSVSVEEALRNKYLSGLTVYVPKGMIQKYKKSEYWYSYYYVEKTTYTQPRPIYAGYYVTCFWANANFMEITNPVQSLSLNKSELLFTKIGDTETLCVVVEPDNADDKSVNWMSSNTNVCVVSSQGQVVATGYGTAVIICTSKDGGLVAVCNVKVIEPVTIIAKSYSREYGEENPTFEYMSDGAQLNGVPKITCEATKASPTGIYPIIIDKGSVTNEGDTYVNGTLTITKAPLTVSTGIYKREQGMDNPQFSLIYEGFKNFETSEVLLKEPKLTTTATKESLVGEYDIIVYGGEAQNYEFHYVNGKLIVTLPSGISNTILSVEKPFNVFSASGVKLRSNTSSFDDLPKGVYVINGKKVVKK